MSKSKDVESKYKKINLVLDDKFNVSVNIDKDIAEEIKKYSNIKGDDIKLKLKKVEDVYRYLITYKEKKLDKKNIRRADDKFNESNYKDKSTDRDKKYKSIILLLESPHCDEFNSNKIPIAPAQGETGKLIDKNIFNVLEEILSSEEKSIFNEGDNIRIIIANPIQYQTSLYMYHNRKLEDEYQTLRNRCWRAIWNEKNIKDDFKERIKRYNPTLIINACTYSLKDKVTEFLKENKFNNIYTSYHPSYWKGFNIKKEY